MSMAVARAPRATSRPRLPVYAAGVALHLAIGAYRLDRYDLLDDETFSLASSQHLVDSITRTHGTMALYYVLLWPFAQVSKAAAWVSLPSLVASCVAVGLLGIIVERQVDRRTGQLASILAALSLPIVQASTVARSYSLWMAAAALSWYLLDRCFANPEDRRSHVAFGVVVVALPTIHGMAVVGVAGLAAAVIWCRPSPRQQNRLLVPCAAAVVLTGALYAAGAREVGVGGPGPAIATGRLFLRSIVFPSVGISLLMLAVGVLGAIRLLRRPASSPLDRFRNVALCIWGPITAATTFAFLCVVPQSIIGRYAAPSTLAINALLATAITTPSPAAANRPSHRPSLGTTRVAGVAFVVLLAIGLFPSLAPNHEWSSTVRLVRSNSSPGDKIVFLPAVARLGYEAASTETAPPPALAGPGQPLGTFDRFGSSDDMPRVARLVGNAPRVWIVVRLDDVSSRLAASLLSQPPVAERYDRVRSWRTGPHLAVWLLVQHPNHGR